MNIEDYNESTTCCLKLFISTQGLCTFFWRFACLEPENSEEKKMKEFYHFEKWVFCVVCICCYLHFCFVCWYLLFRLFLLFLFVCWYCLKKVCGNRETRRKTTLTLGRERWWKWNFKRIWFFYFLGEILLKLQPQSHKQKISLTKVREGYKSSHIVFSLAEPKVVDVNTFGLPGSSRRANACRPHFWRVQTQSLLSSYSCHASSCQYMSPRT